MTLKTSTNAKYYGQHYFNGKLSACRLLAGHPSTWPPHDTGTDSWREVNCPNCLKAKLTHEARIRKNKRLYENLEALLNRYKADHDGLPFKLPICDFIKWSHAQTKILPNF